MAQDGAQTIGGHFVQYVGMEADPSQYVWMVGLEEWCCEGELGGGLRVRGNSNNWGCSRVTYGVGDGVVDVGDCRKRGRRAPTWG